jgi:cholesterol transport system auxiliary component
MNMPARTRSRPGPRPGPCPPPRPRTALPRMRAVGRLGSVLLLALLSAAACSILPEKTEVSIHAPHPKVQPQASWPRVDWQLVVPRPNAPALIDSPRIVVRPTPGELQVYKAAIWTQPVPELLQDAVVHAFEDSGRIAGVARRGERLSSDFELRLDVRRFEADYGDAAVPSAVVEIGARLVSDRGSRVVAQRLFKHAVPAPGTAVPQVAATFEQAMGQAISEIVGWTLTEGQRHRAPAAP